jgi:hypothetical protein
VAVGVLSAPISFLILRHRAIERNKPRLMAWHATKAKWERLYYCKRDYIVFDPQTNRYARPEHMMDLLHSIP